MQDQADVNLPVLVCVHRQQNDETMTAAVRVVTAVGTQGIHNT